MKYDYLRTPGNITLITGPHSYTHPRMHALIVELALDGQIKLLIGGNRYDHYGINYALAAVTCRYERILDKHIRLSRAETCYQMVELLLQTQADRVPSLVLDPLKTFYDESVPEQEINQLLFEAISELRRLSQRAAVVVSAQSEQTRPRLLKALKNAVDRIEYPKALPPQLIRQHSLIE
jgi:hypothetical protein